MCADLISLYLILSPPPTFNMMKYTIKVFTTLVRFLLQSHAIYTFHVMHCAMTVQLLPGELIDHKNMAGDFHVVG